MPWITNHVTLHGRVCVTTGGIIANIYQYSTSNRQYPWSTALMDIRMVLFIYLIYKEDLNVFLKGQTCLFQGTLSHTYQTGIPDLQPANLAYIHWMVSNVPGDKVWHMKFVLGYLLGTRTWGRKLHFLSVCSSINLIFRFMLETRTMSTSLLLASSLTPTNNL